MRVSREAGLAAVVLLVLMAGVGTAVSERAAGVVHVRAIAENRRGAKATLGTRTVVFER